MADKVDAGSKFDGCLRQLWKITDTITVQFSPSVEGMIAGTKWVNEVLMVILVVPSFYHKDGSFEKAALLMKTATSCSRAKLASYDFPFPKDARILREISQAAASYDILEDVVQLLNTYPPRPASSSILQSAAASAHSSPLLLLPKSNEALHPAADEITPINTNEISDRLSVQLVLSRPDEPPSRLPPVLDAEVISQLTHAVAQQLRVSPSLLPPPQLPSPIHSPPLHPLPPPQLHQSTAAFPVLHPVQDILHSPRRHRSASPTSGSRSSSASRPSHVGKYRTTPSSGIFLCPFSSNDSRLYSHPQRRMKAKAEERKYLRRALHDIYSDFTTLKYFCDSLQSTISHASHKPYAADLLWLQFHADYLDCLLLHMSQGPWVSWNELIVDKLTRIFLELLIRVYPNRAYPDFIDESVRKWMKRKRVGISTQFGPIPSFLSDARVTDSGIQPKNGWGGWQNKDHKKDDGPTTSTSGRSKITIPSNAEKK